MPRAMRVGKVNLDAGFLGKNFVPVHLSALIIGHRFSHGGRLAVEHSREAFNDRFGGRIIHLRQHHKTGGALDQCAYR